MMRGLAAVLVVSVLAAAPAAQTAESPALARARALYNEGDFAGAAAAAALARHQAQSADAAELVRARALLELYRGGAEPTALDKARNALAAIHAPALAPRDQVDLFVGLGQVLFLDGTPGAAAELFDTALSHATTLDPAASIGTKDRLLLLDWWATALDRDAQAGPLDRQVRVYERIAARMDGELRQDPANPAANYWGAVAARGVGDVRRAWHLAIAAWVRSTLMPDGAPGLRADLDRLVVDAIIPERVRIYPSAEQGERREALRTEWEQIKAQWR